MNDFLERRMTFESVLTQADQVHNLTFHPSHTFGMFSMYFLGQVWICANKSAVEVSNKMSHYVAIVTHKNKYDFVKRNLFSLGMPLDANLQLASGRLGPAYYCLPPITVLFGTGRPCKQDREITSSGECWRLLPNFLCVGEQLFSVVSCVRCKGFPGTPNEPGSSRINPTLVERFQCRFILLKVRLQFSEQNVLFAMLLLSRVLMVAEGLLNHEVTVHSISTPLLQTQGELLLCFVLRGCGQ